MNAPFERFLHLFKRKQRPARRSPASPPFKRKLLFESLESRLLLSADTALGAIVFVDAAVADAANLVASVGAEVVVLDGNEDGVQRIADVLSQRADISAVHVVSHGVAGRVTLGTAALDAPSLELHAEALHTWG